MAPDRRVSGCVYHPRRKPDARYFGLEVEAPTDKPTVSDPPCEIVAPHSAAKWAEDNKDKLEDVAKKLNIDPKAFEYATWDFLDFTTSRTWKDQASIKRLRDFQWVEDVPVWEGYKATFDDLKNFGVIAK